MADIKPWRGIRPNPAKAAQIAALPYDVYNRKEAREETRKHPQSFLRIDRPETQHPEDVDMYAQEVYDTARELLQEMLQKGDFVQDAQECLYVYEIGNQEYTQTGVAACAAIEDYVQGVIKRHENTKPEKEADRVRHVRICKAQTGPVFLAHRPNPQLRGLVNRYKENTPDCAFVSEDGISHRIWAISDQNLIDQMVHQYQDMKQIYIADGHHRAAAAVKVGLEERSKNPAYDPKGEAQYFLCVLFPSDELHILDYNRVVLDLNGKTKEAFLEEVQKYFYLREKGQEPVSPEKKGTFGMYLAHSWYALEIKEECQTQDTVEGLDASLLQNWLLKPILGIEKPGADSRLQFVGGIRGLAELEKRVNQQGGVAFSMYPTSMEDLMRAADEGKRMPPKSTWFEPKLRSGLFIHVIE